jgi:Ca2+-binding RTX toxin-like protein
MRRSIIVLTLLAGIAAALGVTGASGSTVATCFGKNATITGTGTIDGTAGNDVIVGSDAADVIDGKGGNDLICALGGDDLLSGGLGNDQLDGGTGDDNVIGDLTRRAETS